MRGQTRIITMTTDGDSREDASVYYARSVIVTAPAGQAFQEGIFSAGERNPHKGGYDSAITEMRKLGYTVVVPDVEIIITEES